jgi:Trk-type K+ transport system membrane component
VQRLVRPATYVASAFLALVVVGSVLLALPIAKQGPGGTDLVTAFFTSASAVTVTGLSPVDTGAYWSGFGEAVILLLVQAGGLGISTGTAIVAIIVFRRLGLRARLYTSTESGNVALGEVSAIVRGVAVLTFSVELVIATVLGVRWFTDGFEAGEAAWYGVFHSVMAFNNAGFSLFPDSLMSAASDPGILLPVSFAVILGGIGVPVLYELSRRHRRRPLSLHTRVTLWLSAILLLGGMATTSQSGYRSRMIRAAARTGQRPGRRAPFPVPAGRRKIGVLVARSLATASQAPSPASSPPAITRTASGRIPSAASNR